MKLAIFLTWDSGISHTIDNGAGRTIGESKFHPKFGQYAFRITEKNKRDIEASLFDHPNPMFAFRVRHMWEAEDGSLTEVNLDEEVIIPNPGLAAFNEEKNAGPKSDPVKPAVKPAVKKAKLNKKQKSIESDCLSCLDDTGPIGIKMISNMIAQSEKDVRFVAENSTKIKISSDGEVSKEG